MVPCKCPGLEAVDRPWGERFTEALRHAEEAGCSVHGNTAEDRSWRSLGRGNSVCDGVGRLEGRREQRLGCCGCGCRSLGTAFVTS